MLLENVELRLEAFDYLQLPFAIKQGICPTFPQRLSNLQMHNCGSIAYTVDSNFCMNVEVYVHCCWKFCKSHNMGHCVNWAMAGSRSNWQVKDFNPLEEIGLGTHFDIPWRCYCLYCHLWRHRQHKCSIYISLYFCVCIWAFASTLFATYSILNSEIDLALELWRHRLTEDGAISSCIFQQ